MSGNTVIATLGSDVVLTMTWRAADNTPINLAGMTVAVIDTSEALAGRVTAEIINAAEGTIRVRIEGTVPIDLGMHYFRVQIVSPGGDSRASPRIDVRVV